MAVTNPRPYFRRQVAGAGRERLPDQVSGRPEP